MKKTIKMILLVIGITILTSGCDLTNEVNSYTTSNVSDNFYVYTDPETCVEYFVSYGTYNIGNFLPRYNADGTLKLNGVCVNDNKNY